MASVTGALKQVMPGLVLFRSEFAQGIQSGAITLAFRRWQRPRVRAGGTLLAAGGQLSIGAVERVDPARITEEEARRAGYVSRAELLADLARRDDGDVYRIELGPLAPDPRVALRESAAMTPEELATLAERLARLDARGNAEGWTRSTLELIEAKPEVSASRLSQIVGRERESFKLDVRKLKALGLTESLEVGYRLSPRGRAWLAHLRSADAGSSQG
jgi:hypothetical protein